MPPMTLEPLGTSHKDWGTQRPPCPLTTPAGFVAGGDADSGTAESRGTWGSARGGSPAQAGGKCGPEGASPNLSEMLRVLRHHFCSSCPPGLRFHPQPLRSGLMAPTASGSSQSVACPTLGSIAGGSFPISCFSVWRTCI